MKADSLKDFVLDQLRGLDGLEGRAMFGGLGLYADETFFGILYKGRLYFKTSAATRTAYVARGMKPFRLKATPKNSSYYEVPAEVIEDASEFVVWARDAVKAATK